MATVSDAAEAMAHPLLRRLGACLGARYPGKDPPCGGPRPHRRRRLRGLDTIGIGAQALLTALQACPWMIRRFQCVAMSSNWS